MADTKAPAREPVTCARPGCAVRFIPYRPAHIYCSPRCKKVIVAYGHALKGGR